MGAVPQGPAHGPQPGPVPAAPKETPDLTQASDRTISSAGAPPPPAQEISVDLSTTTPSVSPPAQGAVPKTLNELPAVEAPVELPGAAPNIPAPLMRAADTSELALAPTSPAPPNNAIAPDLSEGFDIEIPKKSMPAVVGIILGVLTLGIYWLVTWWVNKRNK